MKDKLLTGVTSIITVIYGLLLLPYLLYLAWRYIIASEKQARGLDFDYRGLK